MPAAPSVGPGTWWAILVSESLAQKARDVLADLPFDQTTTPDVWAFQPKPAVKVGWQIYACIAVGVMVIGMILALIHHLR